MDEEIEQIDQEEEEKLTCPKCGKGFQDMRGLTSHARHRHQVDKDNLMLRIQNNNEKSQSIWKVLSGIGATILTIIAIGKIR